MHKTFYSISKWGMGASAHRCLCLRAPMH